MRVYLILSLCLSRSIGGLSRVNEFQSLTDSGVARAPQNDSRHRDHAHHLYLIIDKDKIHFSVMTKSTTHISEETNERLSKRINRIIGQLKGIQKMSEEGRDCNEIIQQVSAVKRAIDGLTEEVLVNDLLPYIPPIRQKVIAEMIHRSISL